MYKVIFALLGAALLLVMPAQGAVLDWDTVTWTAGSLSNTYDVDGDAMDDVTITISGDTSALVSGYPASSTALELRLDFTSDTQSITVTVTFLNDYLDATDVSFSLFDIDADRLGVSPIYTYRDHLTAITATGDGGLIAADLTPGADNSVAGSGTDQTVTGNASSGSDNVDVSFGTNYINEFSFTFGNTGNIKADDPEEQTFLISDVKFKKTIPEVGTTLMAVVVCVAMAGFRLFRAGRQAGA